MGADPITAIGLAGLGMQAGGSIMGARNRNRAIRAAEREYDRGFAEQEQYRQQGQQAFNESLGNFTRDAVDAREAAARERRQAASDEAVAGARIANPVTSRQPRVVEEAFAREINRNLAAGQDFGRRLAALTSPTDARQAESVAFARSNEDINRLLRSANNAAQITPIAAQSAFNDRFNPLPGDLLNAAGSLGTLYSFSRPAPQSTPPTILPETGWY